MTIPLQLKPWTDRNGNVRQYVQNFAECIDLDVETYKTGNVRYATLGGHKISNSDATRMLCGGVWIDTDGKVHVDRWTARHVTAAQVRDAVQAAYDAATR